MSDDVYLVTGGSRGIGRAIVERLVADGRRVAFTWRTDEDAARAVEEANQGLARAYTLDLADREWPRQLVTEIEGDFGPIVGLVNNAGFQRSELLAMTSDDSWDEIHLGRRFPSVSDGGPTRVTWSTLLRTTGHLMRLGTDPTAGIGPDSDGDGIGDYLEVVGFEYRSKRWYSNPTHPDTDQDGRVDSLECPERATSKDGTTPTPATLCRDTDDDGTPDLFDLDSDDDGVTIKLTSRPRPSWATPRPSLAPTPSN